MFENELSETLSLNGTWQIEIGERRGEIRVPGAWEAGDQLVAGGYSGASGVNEPAIYRRAFDVPASWNGADIWLHFGAVSYYAEVFVNGIEVGTHEGLWTPFEFDVTNAVRAGEANQLEVRIVKPGRTGDRFPYRDVLVGFLPYVFDTFGGIWQDVTLVAHRASPLELLTILPNAETGEVAVSFAHLGGVDGQTFIVTIFDTAAQVVAQHEGIGQEQSLVLKVESHDCWSPASPTLYKLVVELREKDVFVSRVTRRFGFRTLRAEGERLMLNDAPIHMRGVLSWGWDPNTLAPMPTDDEVREEFHKIRALGFNMVKLCLFVPPENAFRIADEEGMLLWLELPLWLPHLNDHLREQAKIEYADIMQRVHHHPSVVIYSLGCELGADMADAALLDALNSTVRGCSRGALVCDNSGSGEAYAGLTFDYADFNDYHFYADLHYFTPLLDLFHRDWRPQRTLIFGEFCDCDDYRNPADLLVNGQRPAWRDYFGIEGNLDRWKYSVQEREMAANNLPFSDAGIAEISRSQSFVVRKTILERTRARGEIGGYVLTGLRDTPMSTSGVFDDTGKAKYDPEQFGYFNNERVIVLEQGRTRRWTHGGDRPFPGDLFNHRAGELASFRVVLAQPQYGYAGGDLHFRLISPRGLAREESVEIVAIQQPSPFEIARIEFPVPQVERAEEWTLEVELDGTLKNCWNLWFYPVLPALNGSVYDPAGTFDLSGLSGFTRVDLSSIRDRSEPIIACGFTQELAHFVQSGGRAVLIQNGAGALPVQPVPFWRESIKLICDHPLMNVFPHQGYANLQFYHLATDYAFDTTAFKDMEVTPVMRRLDARLFNVLEYIVDARYGAGRLLATTLRLFGGEGDQAWGLEANVAGEYLLHQMVKYLHV